MPNYGAELAMYPARTGKTAGKHNQIGEQERRPSRLQAETIAHT